MLRKAVLVGFVIAALYAVWSKLDQLLAVLGPFGVLGLFAGGVAFAWILFSGITPDKTVALRRKFVERWPTSRFPRIPAVMARINRVKGDPNWQEDDETWMALLEEWPSQPNTENERRDNEKKYWKDAAGRFVRKNIEGDSALAPKQEIVDYFIAHEKWIFRGYYAATGLFYKTWYDEDFLRFWDEFATKVLRGPLDPDSQIAGGRKLHRDKYEPHIERWGEWYFVNVERAFKEQYGDPKRDEIEEQKAHGDARLATEDEAVSVATKGAGRRSSVHDREF